MPFSLQNNSEEMISELNLKQKRKQDAIDLALLVYDLYKESQVNDRIVENNGGDDDQE